MPKPQPDGYRRDGAMDLRKLPRVIVRPLGRHGAHGLAEHTAFGEATDPAIHLDIGLKGLKRLEILIHENDHLLNPAKDETLVTKQSRHLARLLWREGYIHKDEYEV